MNRKILKREVVFQQQKEPRNLPYFLRETLYIFCYPATVSVKVERGGGLHLTNLHVNTNSPVLPCGLEPFSFPQLKTWGYYQYLQPRVTVSL